MSLIDQIVEIRNRFDADAASISDEATLEQLRVEYLGRKGMIAELFGKMKEVPPESKGAFGKAMNKLKIHAQGVYDRLLEELKSGQDSSEYVDMTLPGVHRFSGGLHPLTQVWDEIIDIFRGMGFTVEDGPEAESVKYNFDMLNTPPHHPARDLTDTFYLDVPHGGYVLRTETSPVQIRVMERQRPPIRIIAPGRVYRKDKPDATHTPIFMQVEGLYVDKGVTFSDLKGTVLAFYRALFGADVSARFRPHFFPFTEPSAEVDVTCIFCKGSGCRICKQSGWLEMGGSGMVDPNVLEGVDVDPEVYTGWAFGLGIERIAMLKFGISDIRLFYENDMRFLEQF